MSAQDRELLELAALAAGIELVALHEEAERGYEFRYRQKTADGKDWLRLFDPLTDDGDALRLAVQLQLSIHIEQLKSDATYCSIGDEYFETIKTGQSGDTLTTADFAATRRAIVCAAAEIGRGLTIGKDGQS